MSLLNKSAHGLLLRWPVVAVLFIAAAIPWCFAGVFSLRVYAALPAFIILMLPGFALSLLADGLRLTERLAIAASAGLVIVPVVAFLGSKLSIAIGWPAAVFSAALAIVVIWTNRHHIDRNFDVWDAVAVLIAAIALMAYVSSTLAYPVPFGSADGAFHWSLSNLIAETGFVPDSYPSWISWMPGEPYGYPPAVHVGSALLARLLGSTDVISLYMYYGSILSAFGLGAFALVRRYAGAVPAVGAAIVAISVRRFGEIMWWGQWPTLAAVAFLPSALLMTYMYLQNNSKRNAALLGLLMGLSAWAHTQIAVQILATVATYVALWALSSHRLPDNLWVVAVCLFVGMPVFFLPQAVELIPQQQTQMYLIYPPLEPSGLIGGYPGMWLDIIDVYYYAVVAAAALGIVALLKRRKDLLLPAALALSLLVLYHVPLHNVRIVRFMIAETLLVAILAGFGLTLFQQFSATKRIGAPAALALLVCLALFQVSFAQEFAGGYTLPYKLTLNQYDLLLHMRGLPDGPFIYTGFESPERIWWLQPVSRHTPIRFSNATTTMSDFNYILLSGETDANMQNVASMLAQEATKRNCTLLYENAGGWIFKADCDFLD